MTGTEPGFDGLFFYDLMVLRVDEGSALIAVDGILDDVVLSGDSMDGCIAANDGQVSVESCFAFFLFFDKIVDPLLLFF